jgi:peptidoglycan/LPS O-acetylase OafA/YrhL
VRLQQLDILRAVAVLLVLGRHFSFSETLARGGWSGVDLFFVLSGFLISGLLFAEYKQTCDVRLSRFLIRRGLKIYPAFYAFLGWTVFMFVLRGGHLRMGALASELFFLQSYVPAMWPHTWSLAVEEHFYLALPLLLLFLLRVSHDRKDPFQALPWLFACVSSAVLASRIYICRAGPAPLRDIHLPTHLNLDGLLFGVLLSYLYHFRREVFDRVASLPRWVVLGCSLALIAPCFVLPLEHSSFLQTVGHPMLYFGYGGLLISSLGKSLVVLRPLPLRALCDSLAYLGRHSYSVYLWHAAVSLWGLEVLRRADLLPISNFAQFLIYITCSFGIGIGMARLVEIPALKVRDRLFPSCGESLQVGPQRKEPSLAQSSMAPDVA